MDNIIQAQKEGRAPWQDPRLQTKTFYVYQDKYPVTSGHLLIVPTVNDTGYINDCLNYAIVIGNLNIEKDNDITGYNIGMNIGKSAGQTCMYPHVHLIFRRDGDMEDPRGGVRHVIPEKGNYKLW